jgi:GGDEF domain-containing protein
VKQHDVNAVRTSISGCHIIERIQKHLRTRSLGSDIPLSCSFGLASTEEAGSFDLLLELADSRMYLAKKRGGNQVVYEEGLPGD